MSKKFNQTPRQNKRIKIKTVTLLLGFYFSALVAMVIFTGFFVYSNLSVPFNSVAASQTTPQIETIAPEDNKFQASGDKNVAPPKETITR